MKKIIFIIALSILIVFISGCVQEKEEYTAKCRAIKEESKECSCIQSE